MSTSAIPIRTLQFPSGVLCLLLAMAPVQLEAKPASTATAAHHGKLANKKIEFDHKGCAPADGECRASYVIDLAAGESMDIVIHHTLPNDFRYTVAGILLPKGSDGFSAQSADSLRDTTLTQQHDARFGGYIVTIHKKLEAQKLPNVTLVIAVRTSAYQASFGGGFTWVRLKSPLYAIRDSAITASGTTPASTQSKLVRDADREDDGSYGVATLVHLYHTNTPDWAISFGLGLSLNDLTKTTYYFGPSRRFGDRGALTVGAAYGPVRTLPVGMRENDVVTDKTTLANSLLNPPTRNAGAFFIGMSYSFLGTGVEALNKPFAGAAPGSNTPAAPAPAPAPDTSPIVDAAATNASPNSGDEVEIIIKTKNFADPTKETVVVKLDPASAGTAPTDVKLGANGQAKFKVKVTGASHDTIKVSVKVGSASEKVVTLTIP